MATSRVLSGLEAARPSEDAAADGETKTYQRNQHVTHSASRCHPTAPFSRKGAEGAAEVLGSERVLPVSFDLKASAAPVAASSVESNWLSLVSVAPRGHSSLS